LFYNLILGREKITINKKEERQEQILKAAFEAVADKGFNEVTLQSIADYADVSKGVTNYYFKHKEEVFLSLLQWITHKIHENEKRAIELESKALNQLESYVNAAFASPEKNRKFYKVYLEFLAQANNNKQFRNINLLFYENCWKLGEEIVSNGIKEGVFPTDLNTRKEAISIRAMIDGSLIQWLMRNDDSLHNFYRKNCFETIRSFLTNESNESKSIFKIQHS